MLHGCGPGWGNISSGGTKSGPRAEDLPSPPPAAQGPSIELSLPEAVALGLRNNRTIRSAYLQRIAQKFDLQVAEDRFTPKLTINSSYLARRNLGVGGSTAELTPVATMTTPIGTQMAVGWTHTRGKEQGGEGMSSSGLSLAVIQPLLRNAGLEVNMAPVRIAQLDEKVNRLALKNTVSQTVTDIVLAYRDFLRAQQQLRISKEALGRSRELLAVNRALIEAGRMAEVEVVQTEADMANQEFSVEQAQGDVDATRLVLLEKLAVDPRADLVSTEKLAVEPVPVKLDRALAVTSENNIDLLTQTIAVERAKLGLGVAKNQRLWDVSAVAGTGVDRRRPSDVKVERNSYGGVQVTIPLGDLTAQQAETAATVAVKTGEVKLEQTRQQVEHQTRDAVRNVEVRWRQVEIARRAKDLSARKLEIERDKLQVGRSTNFQVLAFEGDLRQAESNLLGAMIGYLNALTALDQQVGMTLDTWKIALED